MMRKWKICYNKLCELKEVFYEKDNNMFNIDMFTSYRIIVYISINNNSKKKIENETQYSHNDNGSVENGGITMVDDDLITIIYYEKTMKGQYPAMRFNVKNNSEKDINIEPLGTINDLEMTGRFIISNSDGKWASPYIKIKPGESYDTYFGYMDNYSKEQLDLEKFANMDLTFYISEKDEYGGWKFIRDYKVHID